MLYAICYMTLFHWIFYTFHCSIMSILYTCPCSMGLILYAWHCSFHQIDSIYLPSIHWIDSIYSPWFHRIVLQSCHCILELICRCRFNYLENSVYTWAHVSTSMQEFVYVIYTRHCSIYLISDIHRFKINETGGKLSVYIFHHHVWERTCLVHKIIIKRKKNKIKIWEIRGDGGLKVVWNTIEDV